MKTLDVIATVLLVVGGLNWGLVALANFDLVAFLTGAGNFGGKNALGALVYGLVGSVCAHTRRSPGAGSRVAWATA
jgi:uncharacterized membrane protein YuzA (DUF378 family)